MPILPNIHKIAVVRANGLGDLLFAFPALQALRECYPEAEIVYIGTPLHQAFLADRPNPVDRVEIAPVSRGVREVPGASEDTAALATFFARMREERFDLAVQLHGGGRNSNPFTLKLGARITAGTRTPDAPPLDHWIPYVYYQREVLRWLEVVSLVGAQTAQITPCVTVLPSDVDEARAALVDAQRPFAVLHCGSTDRRRQWPTERFAAVGDYLADRGLDVYLTGVPSEQPLIDAVHAQMMRPAHDLCGQLSIGGLTGLLSLTALMVTNDTGPMHVAQAVGSPTIAMFWGPNIVNAGPMQQRKHRPQLSWTMHCPLCGADMTDPHVEELMCDHDTSFVARVTVAEVIGAAEELLGQERLRD